MKIESFNPAEAEDGFRRTANKIGRFIRLIVSIQPKPKTGLEAIKMDNKLLALAGFNPAEAEDGFRSIKHDIVVNTFKVSIQPKPKTGLEEIMIAASIMTTFVSIQPKPKTGLEVFGLHMALLCKN